MARVSLRRPAAVAEVACLTLIAQQKPKELKPGWNLFSKDQDVQLGQEGSKQIEKQVQLLDNREINDFVQRIGRKIASQPQADKYPYTFKVVVDKSINAFALPGGPTYVHTGLIQAADNESQIAGVMAHEVAHVALRHGTNQVTKANFIQLPALLAGAVLGGGGGMIGQLAQLGVGFGAGSLLMKFSRGAERDADLLGARMMSQAGYNPLEMARFFEKLEAQSGKGSALSQFLSDHPNPGNRVKSVEKEIQLMPRRDYNAEGGDLPRVKEFLKTVKEVPRTPEAINPSNIPSARPSSTLRNYKGQGYLIAYPDNWEVFGDANSPSVTIAPRAAIAQGPSGVQIAYGVMASFYVREGQRRGDLRSETNNLIREMQRANTGMRQGREQPARVTVDGQEGMLTTLYSTSAFKGETEVDVLLTVLRPEGVFYMVFISPEKEFQQIRPTFQEMLRSVRFSG